MELTTNEEIITDIKKSKFKTKKKSLYINLIIISVLAIFSGFFIGIWYVSNQAGGADIYKDINIEELLDDVNSIRKEAINKSPLELGAVKSCVLAFDNTFNYENVIISSQGSVEAMGTSQAVTSNTIRIGDEICSENLSYGKYIKVADRFYLDAGSILHVKGNFNNNIVSWNGDKQNLSLDEYENSMGGAMNEYILYIISSKTVEKYSEITKLEDGNYSFNLELHKINSVVKYAKYMKATGGLQECPIFKEPIKLSVVIDDNFRLVKVVSNEKYTAVKKVVVNIKASSVGTLTTSFTYDEAEKIPAIDDATKI